jgi:hypothetical protein
MPFEKLIGILFTELYDVAAIDFTLNFLSESLLGIPHIDLIESGEHRTGVLCFLETFGDFQAHS